MEVREPKLGLKCSIKSSQFQNRMEQENVSVIELYLNEGDLFGENYELLKNRIRLIKEKGIEVVLHHPWRIHNVFLNVSYRNSKEEDYFLLTTRILVELCEDFDAHAVVHMSYGDESLKLEPNPSKDVIIKTVARMLEVDETIGKGRIYWENGTHGNGAYFDNEYLVDAIVGTSLKLCFDISHAFISLKGDNQHLIETIARLEPNIAYYHVVDSMGKVHDSLIIGDGRIDFGGILYQMIVEKPYIYEVGLSDMNDCEEMIKSHQYMLEIAAKQKALR